MRRLFALEAASLRPAVVLHESLQRLHLPVPSTLELPIAAQPSAASEPHSLPRKRKWAGMPFDILHKAGQESTRDNIRFRKHLPSFINTALESSWLIRRCLSRGVRVSAEIAAGNVAVKAAAHGIQAPSFSPGITARVQLPRSFPAAAPSTSGDDMADLFAGVPSSADDAARWERANAARKLAMLQQDIEARLQHNERLAQGFDSACVSPAVSSTPEQQTPASMEQQSEIDKERALTAFLERAVMSC